MRYIAEIIWSASLAALSTVVIVAGCADSKTALTDSPQAVPASGEGTIELSGSDLWAQNCGLCHNSVSPTSYSDGQWDVIVTHMRIQARLAGEEERKIRQFLQASN